MSRVISNSILSGMSGGKRAPFSSIDRRVLFEDPILPVFYVVLPSLSSDSCVRLWKTKLAMHIRDPRTRAGKFVLFQIKTVNERRLKIVVVRVYLDLTFVPLENSMVLISCEINFEARSVSRELRVWQHRRTPWLRTVAKWCNFWPRDSLPFPGRLFNRWLGPQSRKWDFSIVIVPFPARWARCLRAWI